MKQFVINACNATKQFIKKNLNRIIVYAICAIGITAYYSKIIEWYNENIIPTLAKFKPNSITHLALALLLIGVVCDIVYKTSLKYKYRFDLSVLLGILSSVLFYYRLTECYTYVYIVEPISYVDVIAFIMFMYSFAYFFNLILRQWYAKKNKNNEETNVKLLDDSPITSSNDDTIFKYEKEVEYLTNVIIKQTDESKTWSIAITAPWGTGKTSFVNLIKEQINNKYKNDVEIIDFVPRNCKSVETIQEDFFSTLASVLSKYNSRCSHTIKKYMASLQLIEDSGFIDKIVSFYHIWNKGDIKDDIQKAISDIQKKIIVFIDDFDRLDRDEILEVLKLIDSNATFKNLVFVTAFDKEQVNKMLGDDYKTPNACFIDKFFNHEYNIPLRPYSCILDYIIGISSETFPENKTNFELSLNKNRDIFEKYIPTLRDAKRYMNLFRSDFKEVKNDVILEEFLLVEIIKYRFYENLFLPLYKQELLTLDNGILELKNDLDKENCADILNKLFSIKQTTSNIEELTYDEDGIQKEKYGHIYDQNSFLMYFILSTTNIDYLRMSEINTLLKSTWDKARQQINKWLEEKIKINYLIDYLRQTELGSLPDYETRLHFAKIITYLACKDINEAKSLFWNITKNQNLEKCESKDNIKKYTEEIISFIKQYDSNLTLIAPLHFGYRNNTYNEDEYLIKDNDIWPYLKETFIQKTTELPADNYLLGILYQCIEKKDGQKNVLDKECCLAYREKTIKYPGYYVEHFVRQAGVNSVKCEPFWKQIFGSESECRSFLAKCKQENIHKAELAWNFWELYEANGYKEINFERQGNVQGKIENGLKEEIEKLNRMKEIEKEVQELPDDYSSADNKTKEEYKEQLLDLRNKLDDIKLYVRLNRIIHDEIDKKLAKLN